MSTNFHSLSIARIQEETKQSKSFFLDIPESLKENFHYKAGQYLTLKTIIDDEEQRRSYSISTSPLEDEIAFTVKRVKNGLVSNYLCDHISEGDQLEIHEPEGKFIFDTDGDKRRDIVCLASGSGITPVVSIIKTTLEEEPLSKIFLYYGNKTQDDVIFKSELEALQIKYADQLEIEFIYSREETKPSKKRFSFFKKEEKERSGRIDAKMLKGILKDLNTRNFERIYFLCGPGDMVDKLDQALKKANVHSKSIVKEYFSSTQSVETSETNAPIEGKVNLEIRLNKEDLSLVMDPSKTVLENLLDKKIDAPYSCTSGACSSCMAKLEDGEVSMDSCLALDDDEVEEGYILTCQSRAKTKTLKINYDI